VAVSSKVPSSVHPAYEPPTPGVRWRWLFVIGALILTALVGLSVRPVCHAAQPNPGETGFGVRHEQRGTLWYHCEPWIRRLLVE
jgi:hypothetical protein